MHTTTPRQHSSQGYTTICTNRVLRCQAYLCGSLNMRSSHCAHLIQTSPAGRSTRQSMMTSSTNPRVAAYAGSLQMLQDGLESLFIKSPLLEKPHVQRYRTADGSMCTCRCLKGRHVAFVGRHLPCCMLGLYTVSNLHQFAVVISHAFSSDCRGFGHTLPVPEFSLLSEQGNANQEHMPA